jgi:hypothetical protein
MEGTMTTREATCEERLPAHLESRLEDFRSMTGWIKAWSETRNHPRQEDAERRAQEYPLYLDVKKVHKVTLELSTGGPADRIEFEVDNGHIGDVVYIFQDWFDGARKTLFNEERDAALEYIRTQIDLDELDIYARED